MNCSYCWYFYHDYYPHRTPEQCPSVVSLLSQSYNPNVRYGAALALGIACAGTGHKVSLPITAPSEWKFEKESANL